LKVRQVNQVHQVHKVLKFAKNEEEKGNYELRGEMKSDGFRLGGEFQRVSWIILAKYANIRK
jgi:hypothetical protein